MSPDDSPTPASDRPTMLERLPLAWVLAWRYLRGRKSRLLHRTALAALAAVALGVMAMTVAMALMTGYRKDLEAKLVSGNAAVLAYPLRPGSPAGAEEAVAAVAAVAGVTAVQQVAYGQGTLLGTDGTNAQAVTLRGVGDAGDPLAGRQPLATEADGVVQIATGRDLAAALGAAEGDLLRLVVLGFADGRPRFRYQSVRLVNTFETGFAEFDRHWIALPRERLEGLAGEDGGGSLLEIAVEDPDRAGAIAAAVGRLLGDDYLVTDWRQLNRELFSALELQQLVLFFLLGLIVLVSTFNVASTQMVLVRERMQEVGVLHALGLEGRRLALSFLGYGALLGAVGTAVGAALGGTLSWALSAFELIRFDPEVAAIYFIDAVPFRVELADLLAVVGFSFLATILASLLPAWRVLRVRPAEALRYE